MNKTKLILFITGFLVFAYFTGYYYIKESAEGTSYRMTAMWSAWILYYLFMIIIELFSRKEPEEPTLDIELEQFCKWLTAEDYILNPVTGKWLGPDGVITTEELIQAYHKSQN